VGSLVSGWWGRYFAHDDTVVTRDVIQRRQMVPKIQGSPVEATCALPYK
jgi:hypothetical protein